MGNIKKSIYCILLTIIIYFLLNLAYYNLFINKSNTAVYILNQNMKKGEKLSIESLINIKTSKLEGISFNLNDIELEEFVLKDNYIKGQIINESMLIKEEEYLASINKEVVFIDIDLSYITANDIKGQNVSIYFKSKAQYISNILKIVDKKSVTNAEGPDAFTTINILEDTKVLNMYEKRGERIDLEKTDNENKLINIISIEVDKELAIILNNIKGVGEFSLTIKR